MPAAIASRGDASAIGLPSTATVPVTPGARDAEQRRQRRGAARAHRAGERDDLARAHVERQVVDDGAAGQASGARRVRCSTSRIGAPSARRGRGA